MATSTFVPAAVPAHRRLRSISGRRSQEAIRKLEDVLAAWGAEWDADATVVRCTDAHEQTDAEWRWQAASTSESPAPVLWLATSGCTVSQGVEEALFGPADASALAIPACAETIATKLANEALIDLASRLHPVSRAPRDDRLGLVLPPGGDPSPSQVEERRWSGALRARIRIERRAVAVVLVHLPESFVSAWLTVDDAPGEAREPVTSDLAALFSEQTVRVRALLSSAAVSVGDLMSLRTGDVIVTSHALDLPLLVSMTTADSPEERVEPCYSADLGARQGYLAVALHERPKSPGASLQI